MKCAQPQSLTHRRLLASWQEAGAVGLWGRPGWGTGGGPEGGRRGAGAPAELDVPGAGWGGSSGVGVMGGGRQPPWPSTGDRGQDDERGG